MLTKTSGGGQTCHIKFRYLSIATIFKRFISMRRGSGNERNNLQKRKVPVPRERGRFVYHLRTRPVSDLVLNERYIIRFSLVLEIDHSPFLNFSHRGVVCDGIWPRCAREQPCNAK